MSKRPTLRHVVASEMRLTHDEAKLLKNFRAMSTKNKKFVSAFAAASAEDDVIPAPRLLVIDRGRSA